MLRVRIDCQRHLLNRHPCLFVQTEMSAVQIVFTTIAFATLPPCWLTCPVPLAHHTLAVSYHPAKRSTTTIVRFALVSS